MTTRPTTTETTIAEIREARVKIGITPWQTGGRYWNKNTVTCNDGKEYVADCGNYIISEPIAYFIANAPRYIDFLLAELDKRERDVVELKQRVRDLNHYLERNGLRVADPCA